MSKTMKNIVITFIIGCIIFVIGNLISDGFDFKSVDAFLIEFSFYQLYSFVLGYSNIYYFDYFK